MDGHLYFGVRAVGSLGIGVTDENLELVGRGTKAETSCLVITPSWPT